jgi:hypothetical protein
MELSVNGPGSVNSAPIAPKLGAKGRGKCQRSFALLVSSIQAVSAKKNYLKISLQILAGDMQLLGRSY